MEIFIFAIGLLFVLAIADLIVGVSNDAVNFLNSATGSRVTSRNTIMIIAALGMFCGVMFSAGMMEVARKGIFHPSQFQMPEMIFIFLAVMLTDVILLDLFNTYGLPTSTTVSIVFEILGAAVCVASIKVYQSAQSFSDIATYINTSKALLIIGGILLSIVVAFTLGAIVQFLSRLIFTFRYDKTMRRYGSVWGGLALSAITFFILIKGAKGSVLLSSEVREFISSNAWIIIAISFAFWTILLQLLTTFTRVTIFKVIILSGTFSLALAFSANDLVNFIGVPIAGLNAYLHALTTSDPLVANMAALQKKVPTQTFILLIAGIIMVMTLWLSRKARSVAKTEINLARQEEGLERFQSSVFARFIVQIFTAWHKRLCIITPNFIQNWMRDRLKPLEENEEKEDLPFDLVRASVNLTVASILISFATSLKLPLSTTYVTFMVAMGTSLADGAWGRDSAVYRVTGVLTVITGWFMTAFIAFTTAATFAFFIYVFQLPAIIIIAIFAASCLFRTHKIHKNIKKEQDELEISNLKKIKDPVLALNTVFENTGEYLRMAADNADATFKGICTEKVTHLYKAKKQSKHLRKLVNIIIANVFKTIRLLDNLKIESGREYSNTIVTLQEISDGLRDISRRCYDHVNNSHSCLLPCQVDELTQVRDGLTTILRCAAKNFSEQHIEPQEVNEEFEDFKKLLRKFNANQIIRINNRESKTRLSILYYSLISNSYTIANETVDLMDIFKTFASQSKLKNEDDKKQE